MLPRYRPIPPSNKKCRYGRRQDVVSSHPVEDHTCIGVGPEFGELLGFAHGLMAIKLSTVIHSVQPFKVTVDKPFLDAVHPFITTRHPDVLIAWSRVWMLVWPLGCLLETQNNIRGRLTSIDTKNGTVTLDDSRISVLFSFIHHIFSAADPFVVAFSPFTGRRGFVLSQIDEHTVWLRLYATIPDTEEEDVVETIYLLDQSNYLHMFEEVAVQAEPVQPQRDHDECQAVCVVDGPFKGYRATTVAWGERTVKVKISGLVEGKYAEIGLHQFIPL